jgi:hypothetical protein
MAEMPTSSAERRVSHKGPHAWSSTKQKVLKCCAFRHVCAFLKVNKLFKRPHFHHGQGNWIALFGKDSE